MDEISKKDFTTYEILTINRCRIYLQVLTLADIVDGYGEEWNPWYWKGTRDLHRLSTLIWPRQMKPAAKAWALWRRALRKTFPEIGKGKKILGKWYYNATHQLWKWYWDPEME